jgi:hypothetical protein
MLVHLFSSSLSGKTVGVGWFVAIGSRQQEFLWTHVKIHLKLGFSVPITWLN